LDFLARLVADMTGKEYVGDWLLRKKSPTGGTVRAFRTRNSPEQHFMSLALAGEVSFRSVILLDNISSFGGTMSGAMHRILADSGVAPVGLTILKGAS
jgi:phosphoribosylpyrophosphate synthetase